MGEAASTCATVLAIIFSIINIILILFGIGAISIGGFGVHYGRVNGGGSASIAGGAILIVAGCIIFVLIGLALYGAIGRSRIALGFYVFFLVVIILLQLIAIIVVVATRGKFNAYVNKVLVEDISKYRTAKDNGYKKETNKYIDDWQKEFKCCGWNSTSNWLKSPYYQQLNKYPDSCVCKKGESSCILATTTIEPQYIWNTSCHEATVAFYNRVVKIVIGGVGGFFAAIQIVPLIMAISMIILLSFSNDTV